MTEENQSYAKLGGKTLFILIFKRSAFILLPIILLIGTIASRLFIPIDYAGYANLGTIIAVIILIIVILSVLLTGWLEYTRYKIFIDGESIKINRGIISEEQIGIPFRRIKEAAIERGIIDQLLGISKLVLTVLGEEEGEDSLQKSKIILPALDKNIAIAIQDVVLKRAQVEAMNIRPNL